MKAQERKIVFFDIDQTIWNYKNEIPESTIRGIHRLQEQGHLAFINSGRSRSFIRHEDLLGIGFDGIISGCGTLVEMGDETLLYHRINNDLVEWTVNTVRTFDFRPILEGRYHLYFDEPDFAGDMYGEKVKADMGEDLLPIQENWGKWEISKLSCAAQGRVEECYTELEKYYNFIVHSTEVIEIVPKGFSKGTGIRAVCDALGIPVENTVCFGDSVNDLDMFEAANVAIAMGNGDHRAKAAADYVTADMEDDGIEKGLAYLGLI